MSLRLKSLLVFSVALTLLFAIVFALVKVIIERQFTDIEREQMLQLAERFSFDLRQDVAGIAGIASEWAARREILAATTNAGSAFVGIDERTLANVRIDFLAIWKSDGTLVGLQTLAPPFERSGTKPDDLLVALRAAGLVSGEGGDGAILVGRKIALVANHPIPGAHGARAGTLIAGRLFSQDAIRSFEKFAGYRFSFVPRSSASRLPSSVAVKIADPATIVTTVPILDPHGTPVATAELVSARPLHLQAGKTIRIFNIALASAGGILLFVVWYLLDANVIHPVRRLGAKLAEAANHGRLPSDLGFRGKNELTDLAGRIEILARAVAHAEASYRAIVEDQIDFIFRYQPDGRLTFVNEAFCRYLGRAREELIGTNAHRIVAEEDIRRVTSAIERLTPEHQVVLIDHRVEAPRGGAAWFRRTDRAIFSEQGELRELQCVARDVTQTHLTRERLEASETRYRRLFETATDGILVLRRSNRVITEANPELCRILAADRALLLDRPIESIPAFKNQRTLRSFARLFGASSDEQPDRAEIAIMRENGARIFLEITAASYEAAGDIVVQMHFRDISQRKHVNDELRQLSGQLLRLQDEERRRIARELHDSTAQNLSALQMAATQLEAAIPDLNGKAHSALEEIRTLTDLSSREIRTISYLLHPPLLDEVGLIFALRWYVDGFMTRTEKIVRLDIPESLGRLQPEIETTVFRVVQEALTNIHRHSGSRRAWIHLAVEEGILTLEIRDEGKGVAATDRPAPVLAQPVLGVGIAGMRERLRQFGGSLEIISGRRGTTVRAILPIEFDESVAG